MIVLFFCTFKGAEYQSTHILHTNTFNCYIYLYVHCLAFAAAKMNVHLLRHLPYHVRNWGPL